LATSGNGSVTISGTEQSQQVQTVPATPGSASFSFSGAAKTTQAPDCPLHQSCPIYDSGEVDITVNGVVAGASYSHTQNPTSAGIAQALVNQINTKAGMPVTATLSGTTGIVITSPNGANYAFSLSQSYDTADFTSPSFTINPSSGTMSGGQAAQFGTSYDSGATSVVLNGTNYSANWGQGATASSIASALAARMNGTLVTANANPCVPVTAQCGAIISLQANAVGASTNYTLSVSSSSTWGSFAASASGASLSGGADAVAAVPMHTVWSGLAITLYKYDALGNLYCVEQHGDAATGTACPATPPGPADPPVQPDANDAWRRRLFAYDSLSRLRWASNPESGVITYSYDADGNLLQKTSPAPNQTGSATQTVSYCYDALHRVTGKGYGAQNCPLAAPVVTYVYDSGTNAIGHLTSLTDQAGTASYTYDILGRLTAETRTIAGVSKSTSYSYNLDGSVKTLTYPSGRIVTYTPNSAGRLVSAVDANTTRYVSNAKYYPNGAEYQRSMPNIYFRTDLNPRLQVSGLYSDNGQTSSFFIDKTYSYGPLHQNNGNVISITNNKDSNRTQTFTYDPLNRISAGWSSTDTGNYSWGENYSIDAWGNLQISPMGTKAHGGTFQLSGNEQNRPTGMNYDAAGNLLSYLTANYTYDQEDRLSSTAGTTYTYDGNGERVLKSQVINNVLTPVKRYWSMGGNTLAEGDGSGNLTAEYIYFGGKRVARIDLSANTVHYYLSDHLGSTSIVASAAGAVEEESDYYPFGTEVVVTGPGANELKFTGKRRDAESGLDNFGARYNSSSLGRFMTPDWSAQPVAVPFADLSDPQTLNLYTYVRNSPLNRTDPTGHYEVNASGCSGNNSAKCQKKYDKATTRFEEARQKDLQSKDPKVRAAAAAYGDPGKKNGVHLAFEDLKNQGIDGSVNAISNNGKGKVIDVEVKIDINEKGKSLQETVAHEGTHVSEDLNFLTSYDFGTGRYNSTMNFTGRQTEFLGYQNGARVIRDRGFGPNDTQKINDYITHHYSPNYLNNDYFPTNASFPQ
jgi:RHS repeat-associated protein